MDSTIIRHLNTHSKLMRNNPAERMKALATASAIGNWKCCDHCGKIQINTRHVGNEHLCRTCHKKIPKLSTVRWTLTAYERQLIVARIQDANQTHMRILEDVPPQLRRLWGQCLTCVLERFASAKTDEDAYTALQAWTKLKVVLILPTRGGRKKRESRMRTHRRIMLQWIAGNIEECWREGLRIEQE